MLSVIVHYNLKSSINLEQLVVLSMEKGRIVHFEALKTNQNFQELSFPSIFWKMMLNDKLQLLGDAFMNWN